MLVGRVHLRREPFSINWSNICFQDMEVVSITHLILFKNLTGQKIIDKIILKYHFCLLKLAGNFKKTNFPGDSDKVHPGRSLFKTQSKHKLGGRRDDGR